MGLPPGGVEYVLQVQAAPPARKVGVGRHRSLIVDFPMELGATLQGESFSGEFELLTEFNYRSDICAVYDQPSTVPLWIVDKLGRRTRSTYTADLLVVERNKVVAWEVKEDGTLAKHCAERPNDWKYDGMTYHYLPAEAYFKCLGIDHVVIPVSKLRSVRGDNLRLLTRARKMTETREARKAKAIAISMLADQGAIKIGTILDALERVDATPILQLITENRVCVDIDHVSLSDIRNVWLASDAEEAALLQQSESHLATILRERSELEIDEFMGPREIKEVAIRLAIINGLCEKGRNAPDRSRRSIRRFQKAFRESGGDPRSLIPKWKDCGNRDLRVSLTHKSFIASCIRVGRSDPNCKSISQSYDEYVEKFSSFKIESEQHSEVPVVRSTYYEIAERTPRLDSELRSCGGRRLANALSPSFDPSGKIIVATRAFQAAHIDHWKMDLFALIGTFAGKRFTARPWLTGMIDVKTGDVLALWMSYSEPSKKACSMVIRDCVRRHGRLPEMLIMDGGSDFRSDHMYVMLSSFGVIRCERPPEDPRFGQEIERLFKVFKERFAAGMPGYGLSIEKSRAISGAFRAERRAKLSLAETFEVLEAYAFRGYNASPKSGDLGVSRQDQMDRDMATFPCSGQLVEMDLAFLIKTSIEAPDSSYTLHKGRGLHIDDRWYTSPRLLSYYGYKKDLSVRIEPFDTSIVYVCIDRRWIVCKHSSTSLNGAMSDATLLARASETHQLSALRKELANEATRDAARIVKEKLEEIALRKHEGDTKSKVTKSVPKKSAVEPSREDIRLSFMTVEASGELDGF